MQLRFLIRSLWHYRRSNLGVLAGALVGATVLLGALFAGDSVSGALKRLASLRVGQTEILITTGDRFVSTGLTKRLEDRLRAEAAPVLMLRGSATRSELKLQAAHTQILGVDERFWNFAPYGGEGIPDLPKGTVAVNRRLAERLQLNEGDSFVFRLEKPGLLSRDAPLSGSKDNVIGIRAKVGSVVSDDQFGRFSLQANQIAPFSLFASIEWIQEQIEYEERANLILLKGGNDANLETAKAMEALGATMTLEDYGLSLVEVPLGEATEIRSERVFMDEPIVRLIQSEFSEARPTVTYLANTLRLDGKETPYSMVTGAASASMPFLERGLERGEAAINRWLADDLDAQVGDVLEIDYYVVGEENELREATSRFTVKGIEPMEGLAADPLWMPDFPGVSDADDSADWEPGMPLDLDRIRDKDEDYWDDYRGVPKAFISLEEGSEIWENRWGRYTAVRVPVGAVDRETLEERLVDMLDPALVSLRALSFKDSALKSANSPVDIGGLFIGMSVFLIIASLSLVAMLFSFSMQQINRENALLASLGVSEKRIYRWRLLGSAILVTLGSVAAIPLASGYTWGILRFLETIWSQDSVDTLFGFRMSAGAAIGGVVGNILLALATIWFALRKQSKTQASFRLQQGSQEIEEAGATGGKWARIAGAGGLAGGIALLALSFMGKLPLQIGYFLVGFCWLVGGLGICSFRLSHARATVGRRLDAISMGRLNNGRRPMRSLTVVGTLACGVFLVVSVAAFRKERDTSGADRSNGYGGYTYWAETSIPLSDPDDLGGDNNVFDIGGDGEILPMRIGQGDDASCFNLNYTENPRLLAMDAEALAARGAFTFHSIRDGLDASKAWRLLSERSEDGAIRAFVDSATLQWALKKKLGNRLEYVDGQGNLYEVELVAALSDTVFQGSLLIDEAAFLERFPQHEGYRLFLLEDWNGNTRERRADIEFGISQWGGQVELMEDRLQSFHEVENTYIAIFHVLGGLGVVLGSAGLGVVVARNLSERRHEFAVMDAIGIGSETRRHIVFGELRSLIGWGMSVGLVAAIVSIVPSMTHLGIAAPVLNLSILAVAIVANAVFWAYLGYRRNAPAIADLQRDFNS